MAQYADMCDQDDCCGNTALDLEKTREIICYYANSKAVSSLYKVKLMKLLWYADALSYKRYGQSITGLAYKAFPMGALPVGHDAIVNLNGIRYEEAEFTERNGYHFLPSDEFSPKLLSKRDLDVLDTVISKFGKFSTEDIVRAMHKERAYKETAAGDIIQFQYARYITIT